MGLIEEDGGEKATKEEKNTKPKTRKPKHKNTKEKNQKRTKGPVPKEMEPYQFPVMEL